MNINRVKEYLNTKKGELFWRKDKGRRAKKGNIAGRLGSAGYKAVSFDNKTELVHRIIWVLEKGYEPEGFIDHIDRNKLNNNIDNLREVSPQCNMRNIGNFSHNSSGVKGVSFCKRRGCHFAQINIQYKNHQLYSGSFEESVLHRYAAEQCLDWSGCDSNSPAFVESKNILGLS